MESSEYVIKRLLRLDMAQTVRGDEMKFYSDGDKWYLSADDCHALSVVFDSLARRLKAATCEHLRCEAGSGRCLDCKTMGPFVSPSRSGDDSKEGR